MVNVTITAQNGTSPISFSAVNVPAGLTFTDNGNDTATLSGTAADGTAINSPYPVTITATDNNGLTDDVVVTVVVNPAARQPQWTGVGDPANPAPAVSADSVTGMGTNIAQVFTAGTDLVVCHEWVSGSTVEHDTTLVDISNPASPVDVYSFPVGHFVDRGSTANSYMRVAFDSIGQRLFIRGDRRITSYDVSDPSVPVLLAESTDNTLDGNTGEMTFNGTWLVLLNNAGTDVKILDPDTLGTVGGVTPPGTVYGVNCFDDYLLLSDPVTSATVYQYRLDATPNANLWAEYTVNGGNAAGDKTPAIARIAGGGHFATLNNVNDTLEVFDLNVAENSVGVAPVATVALGTGVNSWSSLTRPNKGLDSDTAGNVYVVASNNLVVVDCSNPLSPTVVSTTAMGSASECCVVSGKVAVVGGSGTGLNIYT